MIPLTKCSLIRQPLNSGGYTRDGSYFGVGSPLYYYEFDNSIYGGYLRAHNREHAKEILKHRYPGIKFYR